MSGTKGYWKQEGTGQQWKILEIPGVNYTQEGGEKEEAAQFVSITVLLGSGLLLLRY